jgi:hypothetical protein
MSYYFLEVGSRIRAGTLPRRKKMFLDRCVAGIGWACARSFCIK